jgi:hypothetical protein
MVRYLDVQISSTGYSYGPTLQAVEVYNGCSYVRGLNVSRATGLYCKDEVLDLGGWYKFDRGLNLVLYVKNEHAAMRVLP